jgi:hypothetical protein
MRRILTIFAFILALPAVSLASDFSKGGWLEFRPVTSQVDIKAKWLKIPGYIPTPDGAVIDESDQRVLAICTIDVNGVFSKCRVGREEPKPVGWGPLVVKAFEGMQIDPTTVSAPFVAGEVIVPITFSTETVYEQAAP